MTTVPSALGITVLERGWLSSNNIVIVGSDNTALIDTGYVTHAEQTVQLLRSVLGDRQLDLIVNSHLHSDHCGGNAALNQTFPQARIFIPPGLADAVETWDASLLTFEATGQQCSRFLFDGLLLPGQSICLGDWQWQIHAAKGHDPHAVILYEPTHRVLVSADALWENGFGVVFPELDDEDGFEDVAATLRLIESLNPALVIPGHGTVFSDVAGALQRARSRLEQFSSCPRKHRRHALKVLVKFKLLEWQQTTWNELSDWFSQSRYFEFIVRKDDDRDMLLVLQQLLRELECVGAAVMDGSSIRNR